MIEAEIEHQEVANFMNRGPIKLFIGGDWREPSDGSYFSAFDPGTGDALAEISEALLRMFPSLLMQPPGHFPESGRGFLERAGIPNA